MIFRSVGALIRGQRMVHLDPQATVQEAAVLMAAHHVGAVPVIEAGGRLAGIFTERDLLNRVVSKGLHPERLRLAEVMTADPVTVGVDASLVESLKVMHKFGFRHLPLVERDRVVGVLSCRDIPADYWLLWQNWESAQNEALAVAA